MANEDLNSEKYRKQIQTQVLLMIKDKLTKQEIDTKRAQELSAYVLTRVKSGMPDTEVYDNVKRFDIKNFPELLEVSLQAIKIHVDKLRQKIAQKALELLEKGAFTQVSAFISKIKI